MIGQTVLFDGGEGTLISVVVGIATINTKDGVIQKPVSEVREAPVKVVELTDEVGAEEEMTIVQTPGKELKDFTPFEEDHGNPEERTAENAAEQAPAEAPSPTAVDPRTLVEPPPERTAPQEPYLTGFETSLDVPENGPVTVSSPSTFPPGTRPATYMEDPDGGIVEEAPAAIPPGGMPPPRTQEEEPAQSEEIPGPPTDFLADFNEITDGQTLPTEPAQSEAAPAPVEIPQVTGESPIQLPQRFSKKWLEAQTIEFLEQAVRLEGVAPKRRAKLQAELDRKRAGSA